MGSNSVFFSGVSVMRYGRAFMAMGIALSMMSVLIQCVAQTNRPSSMPDGTSYDWQALVRVASAATPGALGPLRAEKGTVADPTFRLLEVKLYLLTGELPHGSSAERMIPQDEADFIGQYALGSFAMKRAEEGQLPIADAEAVALLADKYFSILPQVVIANPAELDKWARMRWWASGHPDMGEDIEDWDNVLRRNFGNRYGEVLRKVEEEFQKGARSK